jgi:DNA polymerase III epsilon subunit-like protein
MQHVILDVETGGLDPTRHSILSIGMLKTSLHFKELRSIQVNVRHSPFVVDAQALDAKGIDLRSASAWDTPDQAKHKISKFLGVTSDVEKPNHKNETMYKLVGVNVTLYIQFLQRFLGDDVYRKIFDTRPIEITSDYLLLQKTGVVPTPKNYRLEGMLDALGIKYDTTKQHDSLYDVEIARQLAFQLSKRGLVLRDAVRSYVKRYGGDLNNIMSCYQDEKNTVKNLRTLRNSKSTSKRSKTNPKKSPTK